MHFRYFSSEQTFQHGLQRERNDYYLCARSNVFMVLVAKRSCFYFITITYTKYPTLHRYHKNYSRCSRAQTIFYACMCCCSTARSLVRIGFRQTACGRHDTARKRKRKRMDEMKIKKIEKNVSLSLDTSTGRLNDTHECAVA